MGATGGGKVTSIIQLKNWLTAAAGDCPGTTSGKFSFGHQAGTCGDLNLLFFAA